jgi:hypothetical protein
MRTALSCLALTLATAISPAARAEDPAASPPTTEAAPAAGEPAGSAATPPAGTAAVTGEAPAAPELAAASRGVDPSAATSLAATADPALAASIAPAPRGAAVAAEAAPAAPQVSSAARGSSRLPRFGVALGAGFPEFATLNLLYRPFSNLRVSVGPTFNYVGWGGSVGLTLVPVNWWITPLLGLEAGHYLRADYSKLMKDDSSDATAMKPLLRRVDYNYTAVDLGFELGSPRGFSLTFRFGLSWIWLTANGTGTKTTDSGTTLSLSNPSLRATLPSAKLGLQYWF